jgi:hypothetical protein
MTVCFLSSARLSWSVIVFLGSSLRDLRIQTDRSSDYRIGSNTLYMQKVAHGNAQDTFLKWLFR